MCPHDAGKQMRSPPVACLQSSPCHIDYACQACFLVLVVRMALTVFCCRRSSVCAFRAKAGTPMTSREDSETGMLYDHHEAPERT